MVNTEYPLDINQYHHYCNPLEVKYANNKIQDMHCSIQDVFRNLASPEIIDVMKQHTVINDLQHDPRLYGAGLHLYHRNGRLNLHGTLKSTPFLENNVD